MACIEYTWSVSELYNKDGIQVLLIRCNEDHHKKRWEIVENGVTRKSSRMEASVYIDPDYAKRSEAKKKRIAAYKNKPRAHYEYGWTEELNFSWM